MTKIKLCGLMEEKDILTANKLLPEFIGFVFAKKSRRYVSVEKAAAFRRLLSPRIQAVGVFVDETPGQIAELLNQGIIDIAQLHGSEDEDYIRKLRLLTDKPLIKAFRMEKDTDMEAIQSCLADYILLDSGTGGTGTIFDWELLKGIHRPYFLAGGLTPDNAADAVKQLSPYAVDVSSGIEIEGRKDSERMKRFVNAVRS